MSKKTVFFTIAACLAWGPLGLVEKAHAYSHTRARVTPAHQINSKASQPSISIIDTQIDREFIRAMEGSHLKGYVPLVRTTNSGVTIAHGFDLGQLSLREFNSMAISYELKQKLRPYVGLKKYAALSFLKKHPLTISPGDLEQLNVVSADSVLRPLVKYYNQVSKRSFLDLPPAAQTALFSYAYQCGPYFMHQSHPQKTLWHAFVTQDWPKASKQLRTFKTYASRRNSEAQLLERFT
jgi:GH24 family phage-related lysozyme (muramidase)